MAKVYKSIGQAMKGVDNAIALGCKRAMNRSISSTKTYISKSLRNELSLPNAIVSKRLKLNKVAKGIKDPYAFRANVAIAMKRLFPMRFFKPKSKKVKTSRGIRIGVTTKIGKAARTLVPKAFMIMLKNGVPVVAQRKGKERTPTREVYTEAWQRTVTDKLKEYKSFLQNNFKRIVGQQIDFALSKKDAQDRKED